MHVFVKTDVYYFSIVIVTMQSTLFTSFHPCESKLECDLRCSTRVHLFTGVYLEDWTVPT